MGVTVLEGIYDGTEQAAVMVDSGSGMPLGPIFRGPSAADDIEEFMGWLRTERWRDVSTDVFGRESRPQPHGRGDDPRAWPDYALQKLVAYWQTIEESRVADE